MRTQGQKMIDIENETFTFENGDKIHSVTLRVNGVTVELSVQNWNCGEIRPARIKVHDLNDGDITVFAEKVSKKKGSRNGATWTTIKEASQ